MTFEYQDAVFNLLDTPGHEDFSEDTYRTLTAVDSRTNKIAWQKRMPYSIGQGSGSLVTASDLLFHGEPDGKWPRGRCEADDGLAMFVYRPSDADEDQDRDEIEANTD